MHNSLELYRRAYDIHTHKQMGLSERCQSIEEELTVINNKLSCKSYQVTCVCVCVCVVCTVACNVSFDLYNCTHVFSCHDSFI